MYYSTGSGRIELKIFKKDAIACSHSGACDSDVLALSNKGYIKKQLAKLDANLLAGELKEYGEWDDLSDHPKNLKRILWLACWDITENN